MFRKFYLVLITTKDLGLTNCLPVFSEILQRNCQHLWHTYLVHCHDQIWCHAKSVEMWQHYSCAQRWQNGIGGKLPTLPCPWKLKTATAQTDSCLELFIGMVRTRLRNGEPRATEGGRVCQKSRNRTKRETRSTRRRHVTGKGPDGGLIIEFLWGFNFCQLKIHLVVIPAFICYIVIGGFRSDNTQDDNTHFGNVSARASFSKVAYQRKRW